MYRLLFLLVLRFVPAELAHRLAFVALRLLLVVPGLAAVYGRLLRPRAPELEVQALGLRFASPVGLAAGFDKDAEAYEALAVLGFGHVEVGTVTAQAQPGNPRPRLFRLPADHALINRMGFNNHGAAAAARRLQGPRSIVVGVNIGKTKLVPAEQATEDYVASAKELASVADYFVVNVSSPNTPGLRQLQAVEKLRPLLSEVRRTLDSASHERRVPLLVKIAPDMNDAELDEIVDLALELGLDGLVLCNTTLSRAGLASHAARVVACGDGGLSGRPLKERSLAMLRHVRARVGERLTLISVGGVETADDVWQRLSAGASLVQLYTGFIYGGPFMLRGIYRELRLKLRRSGARSLADLSAKAPVHAQVG